MGTQVIYTYLKEICLICKNIKKLAPGWFQLLKVQQSSADDEIKV